MNTPSYFRMFCSLALVLLCQTGRAEMPDLQPIDFQVPSTISGPPGMQVSLTYSVTNRGDTPATGRHDSIYLSTKSESDESAVRVFLGADSFLEELSVENLTATFSLPVTNAGTYYLHLKVDSSEWLAEHNELNNQISRSFTFIPAYPYLGIARLQVPAKVKGTRNQTARYSIDFTNAGPAAYVGALNTSLYWSPNPVWKDSDILLGSFSYNTSIPSGSIFTWENTLSLTKLTDSAAGWIIARSDFPPRPAESQGTNMAVAPFAFEACTAGFAAHQPAPDEQLPAHRFKSRRGNPVDPHQSGPRRCVVADNVPTEPFDKRQSFQCCQPGQNRAIGRA